MENEELNQTKTDPIKKEQITAFYKSNGFSTYKISKNKLMSYVRNRNEQIIIVGYYNLCHPFVFLIFNKGEKIDIGMISNFIQCIEKLLTPHFFIQKCSKSQ